ncbi:hypothetical protein C9415_21895 [Kluyvera sp. Nf5]|nr:hypothetical protein C9415_21895 [Kluyvera sp. Nf5]
MSLVAEILEYIKTAPGSSAADICDAFPQHPRPAVQRAAYRLYDAGYTTRSGEKNKFLYTFNESRIESDVKPLQETRHAKALIQQAGELEQKGLYLRAATVWAEAFDASQSITEREQCLRRKRKCLTWGGRAKSSERIYETSGRFVG